MDPKERWLRGKAELLLPLCKKVDIPAEFLTIFRILFGLITGLIFMLNNYILSIAFLTAYQFISVLDYIDGKLARYQKRFSVTWVKIDRFFHYFISLSFILTLSIAYSISTKNIYILYTGVICSFFIVASSIISAFQFKESQIENPRSNGKFLGVYSYIGIDNPFSLFYFLIILNLIPLTIIFYTVLYLFVLIRKIK